MHYVLLVLGAALMVADNVQSRSAGPPLNLQVCSQLLPGHGGTPPAGNGGYVITTDLPRTSSSSYSYVAGQTYTGQWNNKIAQP